MIDRSAFKVSFLGQINHDSCLWRHQSKLQKGLSKTCRESFLENGFIFSFFELKFVKLMHEGMLALHRTFKIIHQKSGNWPWAEILAWKFDRKWMRESFQFFSQKILYMILDVGFPFLFCLLCQGSRDRTIIKIFL